MEEAVKAFKKKNKNTYEENNRLKVKIPIKHFRLPDFLKEMLKDKYVEERVKLVKKILVG